MSWARRARSNTAPVSIDSRSYGRVSGTAAGSLAWLDAARLTVLACAAMPMQRAGSQRAPAARTKGSSGIWHSASV